MQTVGRRLPDGRPAAYPGGMARRNGPLRAQCVLDEEAGRITRKTETTAERNITYEYEYDDDGRLFRVFRDGLMTEQYVYTGAGQREVKSNGWANESVKYFYGGDGCLYMAASVPLMLRFEYDESGNLTLREEGHRVTRYAYKDTLLRQAVLPDGTGITYAYDRKGKNPLGPVAKYRGSARKENLVMEYVWKDLTTLAACFDHRTKLRYDFAYSGNALARVRLRGHAVGRLLRTDSNDVELRAGCDQVNTPKVFTNKAGREVKWLEYDSFGVICEDTYPELFIPVGFAGGLLDRDTGLVRFGFRDYDPAVGRFTCPDPLGDTGGDHDLYDYCVDDPVNMHDPLGLFGMSGLSGFMRQQGLKEEGTKAGSGTAPKQPEPTAQAVPIVREESAPVSPDAGPAFNQIQSDHIAAISGQAATTQEAYERELQIRTGDWQRQGDNYALTDGGKPVMGADNKPIQVDADTADSVGKHSATSATAGEKQIVSAAAGIVGAAVSRGKTDPVGLGLAVLGAMPETSRNLTKHGSNLMREAADAEAMGPKSGASETPQNPADGFIPSEKHMDAIVRDIYSPSNDIQGREFNNAADKELGDKSRQSAKTEQNRARAGMNPDQAGQHTDKITQEGFDQWKQGGKGANYRPGLEGEWKPDWTPEHAAKVAGQYDKTKDMLDTYKKGLPEGEDVFKDLKARADKLGVGRDSPILSAIAGFGGAAAVGAATGGNGPASSIAGAFAAEQAGKGVRALSTKTFTDYLTRTYSKK